jgi:hypothetical protein
MPPWCCDSSKVGLANAECQHFRRRRRRMTPADHALRNRTPQQHSTRRRLTLPRSVPRSHRSPAEQHRKQVSPPQHLGPETRLAEPLHFVVEAEERVLLAPRLQQPRRLGR